MPESLRNELTSEQQAHLMKKFKIPVQEAKRRAFFIVALDPSSLMPTDQELAQLASLREFEAGLIYREPYLKMILEEKLGDPGHNTQCFRKGAGMKTDEDTGWFCSRFTWTLQVWFPYRDTLENRSMSLVDLIDKMETLMPKRWTDWKAAHPEIFPPKTALTPT